ncbi:MAG: AbrB/MazE/SpoVT family DNA-binding domain-containing protein, partial [Dehalococcoidia bacterium]
ATLGITMQLNEQPQYAFTSSLTSKGQVTLPAPIRRLLGVSAPDKVTFVVTDGQVRVTPASSVTARTAGLLASEHPMLSPRSE